MRGYASNFSKSIRAMAAEEEGLLPASRITRPWLNDAGVTEPLRSGTTPEPASGAPGTTPGST